MNKIIIKFKKTQDIKIIKIIILIKIKYNNNIIKIFTKTTL